MYRDFHMWHLTQEGKAEPMWHMWVFRDFFRQEISSLKMWNVLRRILAVSSLHDSQPGKEATSTSNSNLSAPNTLHLCTYICICVFICCIFICSCTFSTNRGLLAQSWSRRSWARNPGWFTFLQIRIPQNFNFLKCFWQVFVQGRAV